MLTPLPPPPPLESRPGLSEAEGLAFSENDLEALENRPVSRSKMQLDRSPLEAEDEVQPSKDRPVSRSELQLNRSPIRIAAGSQPA